MGAMLEQYIDIEKIMRSSATDFTAEVFFDELQFILGRDLSDALIVRNYGMNSRVMSKDILDVTTHYVSTPNAYKEFVVLHLARNSLYHQLPEILFHPLVLSTPSMSNREIVDAMRENRKKEKEQINFFSPFDTAFFKERVRINDRYLNFFSNKQSRDNLLRIALSILDMDFQLSKQEVYKLFLKICNAEHYKENLPELEKLIRVVLDLQVEIKYKTHTIHETPFMALGDGKLGVTLGLTGSFESELDDIEVTILFAKPISSYEQLRKNIDTTKNILHYFVLSGREVHVSYTVLSNSDFLLGNNFLGYDTNL